MRTLLQNSSAQFTMLFAFTRASELLQQKKGNVYTYPTYTFLILHVHAAIWRERGPLNTTGFPHPIRHSQKSSQTFRCCPSHPSFCNSLLRIQKWEDLWPREIKQLPPSVKRQPWITNNTGHGLFFGRIPTTS